MAVNELTGQGGRSFASPNVVRELVPHTGVGQCVERRRGMLYMTVGGQTDG